MTDRVDNAIDRAVREMLDVEPRADLRARVMAQLPTSAEAMVRKPASGFRRPAAGFRFPASGWVLGSIAAAAIVVLGVFIGMARRSEPVAPAPAAAHVVDRHLVTAAVNAAKTAVQLPPHRVAAHPTPAVPAAPRTARAGSVVATAFTSDDTATTAIDPLTSITPIAVAPVAQEHIATGDITLRPLNTMSEIRMAPLTPSERR